MPRTIIIVIATLTLLASACGQSTVVTAAQPSQPSPIPAAETPQPSATSAEPALPTAVPTLVPPAVVSTPTPPPTATPVAEQGSQSGLHELLASGQFTMLIEMRVNSGQIRDGVFTREYPEGAQTWRMQYDFHEPSGYAFAILEGVAEPGDGGCGEYLEIPAGAFERWSYSGENGNLDFAPTESDEGILVSLREEILGATATIWEELGLEPETISDSSGIETASADLDERQTALALEQLPDIAGLHESYQTSRLTTTNNESLQIFETHIVAEFVASPEGSRETDWVRAETAYLTVNMQPFNPEAERITVDTPILRPGGCKAPTSGIEGHWSLGSFIGGDVLRAGLLDQVGDAYVVIDADGSLTGSFGCRTFAGTGVIQFASIEVTSMDVQGTPCEDRQFEERAYEDALVDLFSSNLNVAVDLEDLLFLQTSDPGSGVVVVFVRSE